MNVLIACEESQRVCMAFRDKGANAYSCDLQSCSGGHPEYHIIGDCLRIMNGNCNFKTEDGRDHIIHGNWDLIIAHPPCTFISNAGARWLWYGGMFNYDRYAKGVEATKFFLKIYSAQTKHICVENPIPTAIYNLPKPTQFIQPYEYGHPYTKKTCLWLRGLPKLVPSNIVDVRTSTKEAEWFNKGGKERQKNRSKTFQGIANAMADQWYDYLIKENQ